MKINATFPTSRCCIKVLSFTVTLRAQLLRILWIQRLIREYSDNINCVANAFMTEESNKKAHFFRRQTRKADSWTRSAAIVMAVGIGYGRPELNRAQLPTQAFESDVVYNSDVKRIRLKVDGGCHGMVLDTSLDWANKSNLGICRAISSKLSLGFIGVFSNSLDGAVRWLKSPRLTRRNTLAPRRSRWRSSIFFFFLFASSRCKLCSRKKNIDILQLIESMDTKWWSNLKEKVKFIREWNLEDRITILW